MPGTHKLTEATVSWLLSKLFPMKPYRIEEPEEMAEWLRYEASNHPSIDPFRPLGPRDSWAGRKQGAYEGIAW